MIVSRALDNSVFLLTHIMCASRYSLMLGMGMQRPPPYVHIGGLGLIVARGYTRDSLCVGKLSSILCGCPCVLEYIGDVGWHRAESLLVSLISEVRKEKMVLFSRRLPTLGTCEEWYTIDTEYQKEGHDDEAQVGP